MTKPRTIVPMLMTLAALLCGAVASWAQGSQTFQTLRLMNPSSPTAGISIIPPSGITSYSITLPAVQGASGQVLVNNGSGTLSWSSPSSTGWSLSGNNVTDASTQFLGTTSSQPLVLRTNSTEKLRVTSDGLVLIGSSTGIYTLDVTGTFGVSGNAMVGGSVIATGLITGSTGLSISGGLASINASSNFNTNINTGSSTGITTIGNTGSTVTIGSIATSLKSSVGSNDRIVVANSSGTLDQASISAVVSAGVATNAWSLTGSTGTDSTTNYLGTTDESVGRPLIIKTDGTERARFAGGSGYAGFGSNAPDVQVEIDGGLAVLPGTETIAGDTAVTTTTTITVGNRSFIVVNSNYFTGSRTLKLSNGLTEGQQLTLLIRGTGNVAYGVRMLNTDSNLRLSANQLDLDDSDVVMFIYYAGVWYLTSYSPNDQ